MALDGMAPEQALRFAAQVDGLRWVKVGLELFVQAGPEVVAQQTKKTKKEAKPKTKTKFKEED